MSSLKREVIFLFGAGASVDAGIPDTYNFVSEFEIFIKKEHSELSELLTNIKNICETFNKKDHTKDNQQSVDIEQLLGILRRLATKEKDLLLAFYEEKKFSLKVDEKAFIDLQVTLEDFIREKVVAKEENLAYLQELLSFDPPIEIFSHKL